MTRHSPLTNVPDLASNSPIGEWFFSGSCEYEPITIRANSQEDAHKQWLKVRKPTNPQAAKLEGSDNVE